MESVFSSRLWGCVPKFLWRGRWFWGAWLLAFLLPATREEARLHFVGSRFFSNFYDQPWQEHWSAPDDVPPALTRLERVIWSRARRGQGSELMSNNYGGGTDPRTTSAGNMFRTFPNESWLRALALRQSLGWNMLSGRAPLVKWARTGERVDPQNAFYPLVLAKVFGDASRGNDREAALERAARCARYDDGTSQLKRVTLRALHKAGVSTWSEEWGVWSDLDRDWDASTTQLDQLLNQLVAVSGRNIASAAKPKSVVTKRASQQAALARSNAIMRVALLFQSAPNNAKMWRTGAKWTRGAWRIGRTTANYSGPPEPTASQFLAFARAQNSASSVRLVQKCAARVRLLAPFLGQENGLPGGAMFSKFDALWATVGGPFGFGVLGFGAYLLGWWWFASMVLWASAGRESKRAVRVMPAVVVIGWTIGAFALAMALVMTWMNSPSLARRGPPVGQAEVAAAWGLFSFFAPPLLLALWFAWRTWRGNRAALGLPARQQLEMNLAPLDAFVLGRAAGVFVSALLLLCVSFSVLWGVICWQRLPGFDWLRAVFPGISPRVVDPTFTTIQSPMTPFYAALCAMTLGVIWLISWRYATDPNRRPIFHDGLRAWKESLGCALAVTAWVYLALVLSCHVSGTVYSHRLDTVATRGEGAFVRGF